ncbi:MAG: MinD/ParA family protein [Alphaproteobacteria bacterium]
MMPEPSVLQRDTGAAACRNVIAVASGKGGVGKTWFAITLSHALAARGRRTLLFDGDLGLANVDIQLGLMPKLDIGGVMAGRATLKQSVTRYRDGGFDIIAGHSGCGGLAGLPLARIEALRDDLAMLASDYDNLVIDLGAGIDRPVRTLMARSGTTLVLTTSEPTALTDAYAFIKVTAAERAQADIRVVVNMARSAGEGESTYAAILKACEHFLKISPPLAGVVCHDSKVADAIRNQTPLLSRHPNSDAAADVEAIAERLGHAP